eukprot:TRINITY_DN8292_c0_g1_i2.p1 TRINITY_DN8292_c0_g1~~TRINITY_DN8292_c0_g1_i2.p1  ORF type:complete len:629 (-),score=179.26 TRINITY_DN8292_c0_g1_i2:320-2206(-)
MSDDEFSGAKTPKRRIRAKSPEPEDDEGYMHLARSAPDTSTIPSSRRAMAPLTIPALSAVRGEMRAPRSGSLSARVSSPVECEGELGQSPPEQRYSSSVLAAVSALTPRSQKDRLSALDHLSPRELAELEKIGGEKMLKSALDDSHLRTRARAQSGTYIDLQPGSAHRKRANTFTHSVNAGRLNKGRRGEGASEPNLSMSTPLSRKKKKSRSSLGLKFFQRSSRTTQSSGNLDVQEELLSTMHRGEPVSHGAVLLTASPPFTKPTKGDSEEVETKLLVRGFGWSVEPYDASASINNGGHYPIEFREYDSTFYRDMFVGQDHQNYIGTDKMLGPVFFSIRRDKKGGFGFLVIRTKKSDFKYEIPVSAMKKSNLKQMMKDIAGDAGLHLTGNIKLVEKMELEDDMLAFEEAEIFINYKIGVLLVKSGQVDDDEFFSNCDGSPYWSQFLDSIGGTVDLHGFEGFDGGLDTEKGSTGEQSVIATYQDQYNIMYHVSTMLPFHEDDKQRVERKRHLGNDVVNIVFIDDFNHTFNPESVKTNFIHVYAVCAVDEEMTAATGETHFRLEIALQDGVPSFGPPLPDPPVFHHEDIGAFIRAKLINGERASYKGPAIRFKLQQTRKDMLRSYAAKYM